MKNLTVVFAAAAMLLFQCTNAPSGTDRKANEDALLQADIKWNEEAKQLDGHLSYFTDDAVVLPPGSPMVSGKENIGQMLGQMHTMPGISLDWKPTLVKVSSAGDMGYTIGTYEMTFNDSLGMPVSDHGKYLSTWVKQSDGKWKVTADMFNSDKEQH